MAGSPQAPVSHPDSASLSLCPEAWDQAADLLVPPPAMEEAEPWLACSLGVLLDELIAAHRSLPGMGQPAGPDLPDRSHLPARSHLPDRSQASDAFRRSSSAQPFSPSSGVQGAAPQAEAVARASGSPDQQRLVSVDLQPSWQGLREASGPAAGPALALLQRRYSDTERHQLRQAADQLRRDLVGDTVTYVVNRNLNSSNICLLHCGFCAFRRDEGQPGAFRLTGDQLQARAADAAARGATELCLQAALDPLARRNGSHVAWAESLLRELSSAAPGLHLHAFSPQELLFFAQADGVALDEVLARLRAAGLGSVPGTAAEVLSEPLRRRLCPEKLSTRAWLTVMLQVHRSGLRATSTLMAGHIESSADRAAHLLNLIALQRHAWQHQRQGFTEFVLLPFIGAAAPAPLRRQVGRDQPDSAAMLLLTAQARLLLGPWIPHHQPSWVKLTLPVAAEALRWGCDDIGGTLMEEHITTMAGASGGTSQSAEALRQAVRAMGRPVRQRTTLYGWVGDMGRSQPSGGIARSTTDAGASPHG